MNQRETAMGGEGRAFQPTLWTLVLRAQDRSAAALEQLIGIYWKPVYFFVRRKESGVEAAKDLTQSFFAHLLERDLLAQVDRERGKFRTFLLTMLVHFLADERERERAKKRGGGKSPVSLDLVQAETEWIRLPATSESPERLFDRQWTALVLGRALERLHSEHPDFAVLRSHLSGDSAPSYAETAERLRTTIAKVKDTLHRLRARLREFVRDEVRSYVDGEEQVQEEILALFGAFR